MGGRGELTERAWARRQPLLPCNGRRGKQWRDHWQVINGILWRLRTGAPWRDLPERYGPWKTCYDRFVRWRRDGMWDRLLAYVQTRSDIRGELAWEVSVDSTVTRAHQHAAGARQRASKADAQKGIRHPEDEALGRSRGGVTTKTHLSCDGKGRPLSVVRCPHAAAAARQHASRAGARRDPGLPSWWEQATAQAARPGDRRKRVQLPGAAAAARDRAHDRRAAGPASTSADTAGPTFGVRCGDVQAAQRGGAVRQSAEAVARRGDTLREAGGELSGDGGAGRSHALAPVCVRPRCLAHAGPSVSSRKVSCNAAKRSAPRRADHSASIPVMISSMAPTKASPRSVSHSTRPRPSSGAGRRSR